MKRRTNGGEPRDISAHLQPLVDDDAFLTALSRGDDPSDGSDSLAALFLELRGDVERQIPPAPTVTDTGEGEPAAGITDMDSGTGTGAGEAAVTPIEAAPSRRRTANPWAAGLIGAAAATAVVVGSGAALYGATPGSPLWGPASAIFGDRATAVQLASTLEDLEAANASGDTDAARQLLDHARELVGTMNPGAETRGRDAGRASDGTERQSSAPTTSGARPSQPASSAAATATNAPQAEATVTERVTETVTVSVSAEPEPSRGRPSTPAQPAVPDPATAGVPEPTADAPAPAPATQPAGNGGAGQAPAPEAGDSTAQAGAPAR